MFAFLHHIRSTLEPALRQQLTLLFAKRGPLQQRLDEAENTALFAAVQHSEWDDPRQARIYESDEWLIAAWARLDQPEKLVQQLGIVTGEIPDAELIGHYWARFGAEGLPSIYGDFSFAAWHRRDRTLHLVVDHLGSQPLFYYQNAEVLLASPLRQALLLHPQVPKQLNPRTLAELVTAHMPEGDPWSALQHVPGGHRVILQAGAEPRLERWWHPSLQHNLYYRNPQAYADEAQALFAQAMQHLLRGRQPIASTLSGGLDSSLATAYAAEILAQRGQTLDSYTSVPQPGDYQHIQRANWDLDEWSLTQELAKRYPNIRHHAVQADNTSLLGKLSQQQQGSWNPLRNCANYNWLEQIYSRAQDQGCALLLTGGKGNASLSYAGTGGLARLLPRGLLGWAWQHLRAKPLTPRQWLGQLAELCGVAAPLRQLHSRQPRTQIPDGINPEWLNSRWRQEVDFHFPTQSSRKWSSRVQFLTKPRPVYGPNPLWQFDLLTVDPFADRALIELLLRYPPEAYIGMGYPRLLARLAGEGRVPDSIRWRTQRGEQAPDEGFWIQRDGEHYRQIWARLRNIPAVAELFDLHTIDALVADTTGRSVPRLQSSSLHRILDIALFIEQSQQRWDAELDY
ncbi:asparagine synthetase B [Pseudaeromonas pectinilytica]